MQGPEKLKPKVLGDLLRLANTGEDKTGKSRSKLAKLMLLMETDEIQQPDIPKRSSFTLFPEGTINFNTQMFMLVN